MYISHVLDIVCEKQFVTVCQIKSYVNYVYFAH